MDETIKQKLYSGGLWVAGLKILALPIGLLLITLMTRILSPEEMGIYFLVSSLVEFLVLFSLLGMQASIVRIVSQALALRLPGRARKAIGSVLRLGVLSSAVVAVLLVSGLGRIVAEKLFNSPLMGEIIYFPAIWVILYTLQRLIAESFRGLQDMKFASMFEGLFSNIISVVFLLFIYIMKIKINISTLLIIIIISCAINLVVSCISLYFCTYKLNNKGTIYIYEILKTSWPLYFSAIFGVGLTNSHLWIIGYYSSKESVAIFGAVSRIVFLLTATLHIVKLVIPAMVAKLYAQKKYNDLEKILRSAATIAGVPSIIGFLFVLIFGETILFYMYGGSYTIGYSALAILSIANIINLATGVPGVLLMMSSNEKILLIISVISGFLSILISFMLVKQFDYIGVAIGLGIGIAAQNLLTAGYCYKKIKINTFINLKEIFSYKQNIMSMIYSYKQKNMIKVSESKA